GEQSGNSPKGWRGTEIQGGLLQAADPAPGASGPYGFKPLHQLIRGRGGHECRCKIRDFPDRVGRGQVQTRREANEIPQVDRLDDDSARDLARKALLARRAHAVADDQDMPVRRVRLRVAGLELLWAVGVRSVELYPVHGRRHLSEIDLQPGQQLFARGEDPISELAGASVDPTPRRLELRDDREVRTNVAIPIGEQVIAEVEYRLQLVAQYAGRQDVRQVVDDGVLPLGAVLIFVDEQAGVRRSDQVIDAVARQNLAGCLADALVRRALCLQLPHIEFGQTRKHADETDGKTVDGRQSIAARMHFGAIEAGAQCRNTGIGVGQNKDGLVANVPLQ